VPIVLLILLDLNLPSILSYCIMPANFYQTEGGPPNRYLASMVWYKCHKVISVKLQRSLSYSYQLLAFDRNLYKR
jgi:hypothetical protein